MVTEDTITLIFISNGKSLQTTQTQESRWRRGCVTSGVELLQDLQADTAKLTGNPGGWKSRAVLNPFSSDGREFFSDEISLFLTARVLQY